MTMLQRRDGQIWRISEGTDQGSEGRSHILFAWQEQEEHHVKKSGIFFLAKWPNIPLLLRQIVRELG